MNDQRLDDETHTVSGYMVPDPRRHEEIEINGEAFYRDRYLDHVISKAEVHATCVKQMVGKPIFHLPSSVKSAPRYAQSRKSALKSELSNGTYLAPLEEAAPHRVLSAPSGSKFLVFLSVDICGGTALRLKDPDKFDKAYDIFLRELGTVAGQFKGTILKTTGDGFLAYVDHHSWTQQCDIAIDMGLTFLLVLRDSINPALKEAELPELAIRIGAECGNARIRRHVVPTTGYSSEEVASDALNRAVKIEQAAQRNVFLIGRNLYELVHVQWLERATEVPFDGAKIGMPGYRAYQMQ